VFVAFLKTVSVFANVDDIERPSNRGDFGGELLLLNDNDLIDAVGDGGDVTDDDILIFVLKLKYFDVNVAFDLFCLVGFEDDRMKLKLERSCVIKLSVGKCKSINSFIISSKFSAIFCCGSLVIRNNKTMCSAVSVVIDIAVADDR
jgi:hypothetical protein